MTEQEEPGRDSGGRFAAGNRYGKGRPPRPVESAYLALLGDALTPERWGRIVARAIADAETGDARARDWVARYALGAAPLSLLDIARMETAGADTGHEIAAADTLAAKGIESLLSPPPFGNVTDGAVHIAKQQQDAGTPARASIPRARRGVPGIDANGRPSPALLRKVAKRLTGD